MLADKAFSMLKENVIAKAPCCGKLFTNIDLHYHTSCICGNVRYFSIYQANLDSFKWEGNNE